MADEETADPGRDFAALMSSAAQAAAPDAGEAPWGWTTDPVTGERRPKKTAGRPRKSPSIDELKADRAEGQPAEPGKDVAPDPKKAGRGRGKRKEEPGEIPYNPGRIARGMDKLYRRTGKLIKGFDPVLGEGFIAAATKHDEDTVTVGEAWDELARTNPRVRAFLLRLIAGGAYAQLLWAHIPILLAVMATLEQHRKGEHPNQKRNAEGKIVAARSFGDKLLASGMNLVGEAGTPDGGSDADGTILSGLKPEDLQQMMGMAQSMMASMGQGRPATSRRGPPAADGQPAGAASEAA